MTESPDLKLAIAAWRLLLGDSAVLTGDACQHYQYCTTSETKTVPAVLFPSSEKEVVEIVKIAAHHKVPVYPISRGKNWGYGSGCPTQNNCVVIDFKLMNQIEVVSEEFCYCIIEPGVTQGQLSAFLAKHHPQIVTDVTASSPESSVVGNILERGLGVGIAPNRFEECGGLHVVLASSEVLKTGFGRFQGVASTHLYKYGIGPFLDGIFTQSNFGIVTKMTVYLRPKPETIGIMAIQMKSDEALSHLFEALRPLLLSGVVSGNVKTSNNLKVLSTMPDITSAIREEPDFEKRNEKIEQLITNLKISKWSTVITFYGNQKDVHMRMAIAKSALKTYGSTRMFNDKTVKRLSKLKPLLNMISFKKTAETIKLLEELFKLSSGVPSDFAMAGAYWSFNSVSTTRDLIIDKVGLYWFTPVVPMKGALIQNCLEVSKKVFDQFGFDFFVTVNSLSPRTACLVMTISYDKASDDQKLRAEKCYHELLKANLANGYYPYRTGNLSAEIFNMQSSFDRLVTKIRTSIDPMGIISPTRYGIKEGKK